MKMVCLAAVFLCSTLLTNTHVQAQVTSSGGSGGGATGATGAAGTAGAAGAAGATGAGIVDELAVWKTVIRVSGSHTAAKVAGTYAFGNGEVLGLLSGGTLPPPTVFYLDPADFPTVAGLGAVLQLSAIIVVNDQSPTGNHTVALHPVTRPATTGSTGLNIYTVGAAVAGSACAFNTPAPDAMTRVISTSFAVPTAGFYVIALTTTTTVGTSVHLHLTAALQNRNQ